MPTLPNYEELVFHRRWKIRLRRCGSLVGDRPDGKFGAIASPHFAENPVQIFLDGSFREVELVCNFLVELGLADEIHNLPLSETEHGVEGLFDILGRRTIRADSFAALTSEFLATAKTIPELPEFNDAGHDFKAPSCLLIRPNAQY